MSKEKNGKEKNGKEKKETVIRSLILSKNAWEKIKEIANKEHRSTSYQIRLIIDEFIKNK